MMLHRIADSLFSALLAPPCAACGSVLNEPLCGAVCDACWNAVAPLPTGFVLDRITRAHALGAYDGPLRAIVHALKYDGRRSIAPRLARLMAAHGHEVLCGIDCAVPVPLHRIRLRERGFNQADVLARGLGVPVRGLLQRANATRPQVGLDPSERRKNVSGAFVLKPARMPFSAAARAAVGGAVIVLVDDVATTGATLEACARVLLDHGAAEVRALTAARVVT
jgi:ComF family protein